MSQNTTDLSIGSDWQEVQLAANDKITLTLQCPVLSVGGSPQTFGVVAFR